MVDKRTLPDKPLSFIQECVRQRRILWTYHVNMRMRDRFISRRAILDSVAEYEIIETYPEDKYLPSYLVFSQDQDMVFHILFAVDVRDNNVRVVTTYYPDHTQWNTDLKTRRKL